MPRSHSAAGVVAAFCIAGAAWSAESPPPGVVIAEATELSFPLVVEAVGTARANESIEVRPKLSEMVSAIRFEEGEEVAAGEVLVELQDTQARAAVAQAKAELVDSQSQFRRAQELYETQAVSASQLEQLEAERDADRAALDAAQARLADTVIRAPFGGHVGLRRISTGSLVGPDTVITTLDDTDPIKIDFDVPETAIARLSRGLRFEARSAAYPEERFEGRVISVDTRVDPVSRSIAVRGQIPNPDGLLRAGMFLSVRLIKDDVAAVMLPEQAIFLEESRQFVYVLDAEEVVARREVRTGRRRPGQVEIVEGIRAGERVIVEGLQKAREGEPVEVLRTLSLAESGP